MAQLGDCDNKVKIILLKLLGIACRILTGKKKRLDRTLVKRMSHKCFVELQNFKSIKKKLGGALVKWLGHRGSDFGNGVAPSRFKCGLIQEAVRT